MAHAETVMTLLTIGTLFLTIAKVYYNNKPRWWEIFPIGLGACVISWVAYFVV